MKPREFIEWCDMWVTGADVDEGAPRALLVGDSITQSYYQEVELRLGDKFRCAKLATSLCVCDPRLRTQLALLLDEFKFDVIHFNNGHHGWEYTEQAYGEALAGVMDVIMARGQGCRLIWASTTPAWVVGVERQLAPKTERVRGRNRIAAKLATARGLPVHDLFGKLVDHRDYFADDGVHLSRPGLEYVADQVAAMILGELR